VVGAALVADRRIAGVVFTGSHATAKAIQRSLCEHHEAILPLVAETGGQNAMIVDSTALLEQVVDAVMQSAFRSAGQRCSALRVLAVQHEVADRLLAMVDGAMRTLVVGDPADPATDVGPVIDEDARRRLTEHVEAMRGRGRAVRQLPLPPGCERGSFVAPTLVEIESPGELDREHFGPILHVTRFPIERLDALVDGINALGFGLTLGIHTRIDARAEHVRRRARIGNVYVNRNMIGAVVGVQPFGGDGLSGTGPKAGGPHYLLRFVTERTLTVNTAAAGGNLALLAG
jgi:RHH-type transcriptional regulator, proline utilization regulon repressor / proline dehydrogenase / delta 1-pyrroline-5-carboxylate dehydrogenase